MLWTEEGFDFAWHVMVMEKNASAELRVRDPESGRIWIVQPTQYLTRYQARMASSHPDMLLSLAHLVAEDFRRRGVPEPEVRADVFASLNGRPRARLVDPDVDLARVAAGIAPKGCTVTRVVIPIIDLMWWATSRAIASYPSTSTPGCASTSMLTWSSVPWRSMTSW